MPQKSLTREQIRLLLHFQWLQDVHFADAAKKINELYGIQTVGRTTAYDWYKRFENEGMSLKDKKHTGRKQKIDRKAVVRYIKANPTSTTRIISEDFDCQHSSIVRILRHEGKIY